MDQPLEIERLEWDFDRRWGVEIELNAFDGKSRPDNHDDLPKGIPQVARLIHRVLDRVPVQIHTWRSGRDHVYDHDAWVVKPDGSCGMEVCSPVLKGWRGLDQVCRLIEAFREDPRIKSDHRCSFHIHVNVADLTKSDVATIGAKWVKSEAVFLDSVPPNRKRSRYCQVIGMCDLFDHRERLQLDTILDRLGRVKYFTLNNLHYSKNSRKTVEYRIAENEFCLNPFHAKNWIKLVVLFTEMALRTPFKPIYDPADPWSALCWLDPQDVLTMMGLMPNPSIELSAGLRQTRDWFIARMHENTMGSGLPGMFSDNGRSYAFRELKDIMRILESQGTAITPESLRPSDPHAATFDPRLRT